MILYNLAIRVKTMHACIQLIALVDKTKVKSDSAVIRYPREKSLLPSRGPDVERTQSLVLFSWVGDQLLNLSSL